MLDSDCRRCWIQIVVDHDVFVLEETSQQMGSEVDEVLGSAGAQADTLGVEGAADLPSFTAPENITASVNEQDGPVRWVHEDAARNGPASGAWPIDGAGWLLLEFLVRPLFVVPAAPPIDGALLKLQGAGRRRCCIRF